MMNEPPRPKQVSPEIYVYATNKNFFNLYDALRINKVKVELAGYDKDSGKQTGIAAAWLDADDLKLLAHLVLNRLFTATANNRFERFGGSEKADGHIESRTFIVEWDDGGGKFARYPYRVTITNGPGQKTALGAVMPAGEPTARVQMRIPETDLMKVLLIARDYVLAHDFNQHNRIVAEKTRELRARLEQRDAQNAPAIPNVRLHPAAEEEATRPAARSNGSGYANGNGSHPAPTPIAEAAPDLPPNVTPLRRNQPAAPTSLPAREPAARRAASR